jgi:hypothetical protein
VAKERLRLLEAKMLRQQPVRQPLFPGGWFAKCHEAELTGTNGCFTRHSQLVNREIGSEPVARHFKVLLIRYDIVVKLFYCEIK